MNPILLDIPEQFETDRLVVRCPRDGDGRAVNEAILESAETLGPWMAFVHPVPAVEDTELNLRMARAKWILREDLRLLIFDRGGRFLGSSGLSRMDWKSGSFEIGYWLRDSESGKGYMTEAVGGIVGYAAEHLGARRIEIRCDSRNRRSAAVALRNGFVLEAILHNHRLDTAGEIRDTFVFAKIRQEDGRWGGPATVGQKPPYEDPAGG